MKIGIVGAGRIASALVTRLAPKGHELMISNSRGAEAVRETAEALGCLGGSAEEAAQFGNVTVVTVPLNAFDTLPAEAIGQRIVIDTCNYYPGRDGVHPEFEGGGETTSGQLQRKLPKARVVKAFNSITSPHLEQGGKTPPSGGTPALPIASDDEQAATVVSQIVRDAGFEPVHAGPLAESWRFERARPVYCRPLDAQALQAGLAATRPEDFVPENSWKD